MAWSDRAQRAIAKSTVGHPHDSDGPHSGDRDRDRVRLLAGFTDNWRFCHKRAKWENCEPRRPVGLGRGRGTRSVGFVAHRCRTGALPAKRGFLGQNGHAGLRAGNDVRLAWWDTTQFRILGMHSEPSRDGENHRSSFAVSLERRSACGSMDRLPRATEVTCHGN